MFCSIFLLLLFLLKYVFLDLFRDIFKKSKTVYDKDLSYSNSVSEEKQVIYTVYLILFIKNWIIR